MSIRLLKILRILKIARHTLAVKIVMQTFIKSHKKVLVNMAMLVLFAVPCGFALYICERGLVCSVVDGTESCLDHLEYENLPDNPVGKVVVINEHAGSISLVSNALYGFWLTIVTITSEGYGRIYAVTPIGRLLVICFIIFGTIYLSIPVAVMCNTYMDCFKKVVADERKLFQRMKETFLKMSQIRRDLSHFELVPVLETGNPEVDRALMNTTKTNQQLLSLSINKLLREYWTARETLARSIVVADGDPAHYILALQELLRFLCSMQSKVDQVESDLQLYKALPDDS
jgi:hypothetical protein